SRTVCGNRQLATVEPAVDFRTPSRQAMAHRLTTHAMSVENPTIHAIYRYPVKALSPEPLERTYLAIRQTLPGDRLYAIENRPCRRRPSPCSSRPTPATSPTSVP